MARSSKKSLKGGRIIDLNNGDRLSQAKFHDVYSRMPEDYRAELIGGIVFEPSPVSSLHGDQHSLLTYLFETYAVATPGVRVSADATVILGEEDEVQPDLSMRVLPEHGGQSSYITRKSGRSRKRRTYISGAPELVAEIAYSSIAIDLHLKKERYSVGSVSEYVVVCLDPEKIYWFDLKGKRSIIARNRIFRSNVFPGLWLDSRGIFQRDYNSCLTVLNSGLKTQAHQDFCQRMTRKSR